MDVWSATWRLISPEIDDEDDEEEDDEVSLHGAEIFFFEGLKNPSILGASREGGGWQAPICLSQWNSEDV